MVAKPSSGGVREEFQTPTFPDELVVAVRRLNSVSDGKVGVWNSPNLKWHSNEDCSPCTSRCCGWRGAGFRAGDRGRTLQCSGPSCPSGIHRYYGRNVSACRPISSLGSGGCRPGLECNNVRQHLGSQTDWKSIGGHRSDPHLNVCDRIQRLQAPVRDVVQSRNAELFPCGVLLGRRTRSTDVLAFGRLEYRVAC